jgi:hypothetical protein
VATNEVATNEVATNEVATNEVATNEVATNEVADANVNVQTLILQQMFELFLNQNKDELDKYKIVLYPEIQNYLLEFCKENPSFFTDVENSLKQIIVDNEINAKDIPDILCLIIKIYGIIKHKEYPPNVDPYEIIELLVQILLVIHLKQTNKMVNVEEINASVEQIVSIIRVAVELLKLPLIKMTKSGCLTRLFKKK